MNAIKPIFHLLKNKSLSTTNVLLMLSIVLLLFPITTSAATASGKTNEIITLSLKDYNSTGASIYNDLLNGKIRSVSYNWTSSNESVTKWSHTANTFAYVIFSKSGNYTVSYNLKYTFTGATKTYSASFTWNISVTENIIYVNSISVSPSSYPLTEGETKTLSYQIYPTNATNKTVSWYSSNTSVATVSNGVVTAKSQGSATIYCEACDGSGKFGTCYVSVSKKDIPVSSISINNTSITLEQGTGTTLSATVLPSNATNKSVKWDSNNTSVATVSTTGYVKAISAGNTKIVCSATDGSGCYATCDVVVRTQQIPVTDINLDKTNVSTKIGKSVTLTANILPTNATNTNITWSYSDKSIISVSENNNKTTITALKKGETIVTATSHNGKSSSCIINITDNVTDKPIDLYLIGDISNWNFSDTYKMRTLDYETYTLDLSNLEGYFTINSITSEECYGKIETVKIGESYTLIENGGTLQAVKTLNDITIKFNRSSKILKIEHTDETIVTSLAEFLMKGSQIQTELTADFPLTVTHVTQPYCYVIDDKGTPGLIYGTTPYNELDIIPAGWKGKYSPYNGLPEIIPSGEMPSASGKGTFSPKSYTLSEITKDMVNEIVIVKDVVFTADTPDTKTSFIGQTKDNSTRLTFRNQLLTKSVPAGTYDVKCAVSLYGTELQAYPIEYYSSDNGYDYSDYIYVIRSCNNYDLSDGSQKLYARTVSGEKIYQGYVTIPSGEQYVFYTTKLNDTSNRWLFTDIAEDRQTSTASGISTVRFPDGSLSKGGKYYWGWPNFTGTDVHMTVNLERGSVVWVIGDRSDVSDIKADIDEKGDYDVVYYNLQGVKVDNPGPGIYIKRIGSKSQKVIIR